MFVVKFYSFSDSLIMFAQKCTVNVLGACSLRKIFRPYENASEAVGDDHNRAKFMATELQLVVSRSLFRSESAFVYCPLGAADLLYVCRT